MLLFLIRIEAQKASRARQPHKWDTVTILLWCKVPVLGLIFTGSGYVNETGARINLGGYG